MKTLIDLASRVENMAANLEKEVSRLSVLTANVILAELLVATPVDTSEALSNWQVALHSPAKSKIKPYFLGVAGSTREQSAEAAHAAGKVALQSKKPGDTVYIVNTAGHITLLNMGWSAQAPAGFVERSVMRGRGFLKRQKLKL